MKGVDGEELMFLNELSLMEVTVWAMVMYSTLLICLKACAGRGGACWIMYGRGESMPEGRVCLRGVGKYA